MFKIEGTHCTSGSEDITRKENNLGDAGFIQGTHPLGHPSFGAYMV